MKSPACSSNATLKPGPELLEDWHGLERDAAEPAAVASPCWLPAAVVNLPAPQCPRFCMPRDAKDLPMAVIGLRMSHRFAPLGPVATTRWGEFFFSGLPLLRAGREEASLRTVLEEAASSGACALELAAIPLNGAVAQAALRLAEGESGMQAVILNRWKRAALDATRDPEKWWRQDVSPGSRRKWTRLRRRMEREGDVHFRAMEPDENPEPWLDAFLTLERAGWKGRAGTAIACHASLQRFVTDTVQAHAAENRLRFWQLDMDGRPVASLFGFLAGSTLWLGKIAYDETLARHSPGALLMIEATRHILRDETITFADSSADPDHPMIDHLWKERLEMADILLTAPHLSEVAARALIMAERTRRTLRERVKRIWHAFRASMRKAVVKKKRGR